MKYIFMGDRNHEITITDAAYDSIWELVLKSMVCATCELPYTVDTPNVAKNTCLPCFLKRDHHSLLFLGLLADHSAKGYKTYKFIDPQGYVYLTYSHLETAELSKFTTILHWGFPCLETYEVDGEEIRLHSSYWRIYGNFRESDVVVLEYEENFSKPVHLLFLAYIHGDLVAFNKRTKEAKKLLREARAYVETQKDGEGHYQLSNGNISFHLLEGTLLQFVSDVATKQCRGMKAR